MIEIFYARLPNPATNKTIGKLWNKMHFQNVETITIPEGVFRTYWRLMPNKEIQTKEPFFYQFERLFKKYNSHRNPYGSYMDPGQPTLKQVGVRHTSMSVGDMFKVDGQYWMVGGVGFIRVRLK